MNENNQKVRKCLICHKTIVGKNKTGICTACKKEMGDRIVNGMGILTLIGGSIFAGSKFFTKKD